MSPIRLKSNGRDIESFPIGCDVCLMSFVGATKVGVERWRGDEISRFTSSNISKQFWEPGGEKKRLIKFNESLNYLMFYVNNN